MHGLKERIRRAGREAGFDKVGFAPLAPAATARAYLDWIERGDHASMHYMARNRAVRCDPRLLLDGGRSAVVVAAVYHPHASDPAEPAAGRPAIARYARGRDYHRGLRKRLRRLAGRLPELAGRPVRTRICVDTAPLLERDLAARAGIGWVGKHTNLVSRDLGNWFFLGTLLTDLDLPGDDPEPDRCGTCRACLDACPTGALVGPRRLDARRCLSFWTIENRGPVPPALHAAIGARLFGCDECLAACPWNRFAPPTADPDWTPHPGRRNPDPLAWIRDPGSLESVMRGSALRRAGREGLLRNARIVLANLGIDPSGIPC